MMQLVVVSPPITARPGFVQATLLEPFHQVRAVPPQLPEPSWMPLTERLASQASAPPCVGVVTQLVSLPGEAPMMLVAATE